MPEYNAAAFSETSRLESFVLGNDLKMCNFQKNFPILNPDTTFFSGNSKQESGTIKTDYKQQITINNNEQ